VELVLRGVGAGFEDLPIVCVQTDDEDILAVGRP